MMKLLLVAVAVLVASCGAENINPSAVADSTTEALPASIATDAFPTSVATDTLQQCPITIPPQPGLVPPEPYPQEAPPLYGTVWYGTSELWTMLNPEGEAAGKRWLGGEKTFWWSEGYLDEPTPAITVTGRQLDGTSSFQAGGPGTNGSRPDIGSFLLVGVLIPNAGCWELTARYQDATLSYVVWVAID